MDAYLFKRPFNLGEEGTDEEWSQKMGILNALYLPDRSFTYRSLDRAYDFKDVITDKNSLVVTA